MLRASIDLGTNTCLLLIAEWDEKTGRLGQAVHDEARVVRLGQGVDDKRELQPAAMGRALACLRDYSELMKKKGVLPAVAVCVATSQARDARNSEAFFRQVFAETGLIFRILSGEEEAQATFLGALLPEMKVETSLVIDIGGGSTEIVSHIFARSIDCGSVRLTERYLKSNPVTDAEFSTCLAKVDQMLQGGFQAEMDGRRGVRQELVAVAGTATTLAGWRLHLRQFSAEKINQLSLSRDEIKRMVGELKSRTLEERQALPGMEPGRSDVLLAGALILWRMMELFHFSECRVSTRGLRYGVLLTQVASQ